MHELNRIIMKAIGALTLQGKNAPPYPTTQEAKDKSAQYCYVNKNWALLTQDGSPFPQELEQISQAPTPKDQETATLLTDRRRVKYGTGADAERRRRLVQKVKGTPESAEAHRRLHEEGLDNLTLTEYRQAAIVAAAYFGIQGPSRDEQRSLPQLIHCMGRNSDPLLNADSPLFKVLREGTETPLEFLRRLEGG
jgi:hypothetical protein